MICISLRFWKGVEVGLEMFRLGVNIFLKKIKKIF